MHTHDGMTTRLLPYSGRQDEYIQSISRHGLNAILLDAASMHNQIEILFDHSVAYADVRQAHVQGIKKGSKNFEVKGDILIGTDGAGSDIRQGFMNIGSSIRFNYSQDFLDHGYKELEIPAGLDKTWQIEKNALHIWPRTNFMLIALPNLDGSFTVTLFLPFDGSPGFNQLHDKENILEFFKVGGGILWLNPERSQDIRQ